MVIGLAFLIMIVGLLMYFLASNAKVGDVGRIMFAVGLFALVVNSDKMLTIVK